MFGDVAVSWTKKSCSPRLFPRREKRTAGGGVPVGIFFFALQLKTGELKLLSQNPSDCV